MPEVDLMAELDATECRCEDHEPDPATVHRCPMHASWEIHRLGEVVTQVTAQRDAAREETRTWRTMHRAAVAAREAAEVKLAEARRRVALAEDAADRLTAAGRGEIERLAVERDRALSERDDALAGQGAALHALSRVVDERRAAREEAEQLRAELEATEPAPAEPQRAVWRVTVDVPLDAPHRDDLFAAVARAVAEWEPPQRDGWDACVSAQPTTIPAWRLAPGREVVADLGLTGTWDAPGEPEPATTKAANGEASHG